MELGIVQCGIGSYGIDTGNSDNSEDARRQTERCFDRQLVDIIEMTPLTLTDRRMYNFLLANAWDKIAEPVQHVIPKRELQNTLHKGTDRLEDSVRRLMSGDRPASRAGRQAMGDQAGAAARRQRGARRG
jgi:hypothetical protein